jgi:hypothetical protein
LSRPVLNAKIKAEAFSGEGFITALNILDSGFGYFGRRLVNGEWREGEPLTLISELNANRTATAYGFLGKQGQGQGYHPNERSFLSSNKYLADNDFYQEYSYQVLTALPFDKYKQTLVEILHVAGTKPFGGYVGTQEEKVNIVAASDTQEWSIKQFPMFVNENTFYPAGVYTESQLLQLNLEIDLDFT